MTWHLDAGQPALGARERDLVARTLLRGHGTRYHLLAFVVMDDHVHVVVEPGTVALEKFVHSWKSFSTHELQRVHSRRGSIWRSESLDRILLRGRELTGTLDYIAANPWIRWPHLTHYAWVWDREERGERGERAEAARRTPLAEPRALRSREQRGTRTRRSWVEWPGV